MVIQNIATENFFKALQVVKSHALEVDDSPLSEKVVGPRLMGTFLPKSIRISIWMVLFEVKFHTRKKREKTQKLKRL